MAVTMKCCTDCSALLVWMLYNFIHLTVLSVCFQRDNTILAALGKYLSDLKLHREKNLVAFGSTALKCQMNYLAKS